MARKSRKYKSKMARIRRSGRRWGWNTKRWGYRRTRKRRNPGIPALFEKAKTIGASKTLLKKRLQQAKSVMYRSYAEKFKNAIFDFKNKRLIGRDGLTAQWVNNGETSRGSVFVLQDERAH